MKNWKVWMAFLLVFALGVTSGILGGGYMLEKRIQAFREVQNTKGWMRTRFLSRIENEVHPDAKQMEEIRSIVTKSQKQIQELREQAALNAVGVIEDTGKEIEEILTPEQREKFSVLMDNVQLRIKRFRMLRSLRN